MNTKIVKVARVYLSEGEAHLNRLLGKLRTQEKLRGVTVFRGVSGFGPSGVMHVASITDLSLDLPIILEFFDEPSKVDAVLEHIQDDIKPGHTLCWTAQTMT